MATINLLDLDVDALFVKHNVAEIDVVHKKIQAVVENKREELRTMVGERYRDLLKAADTISAMQESSSTLIAQIDCISENCRKLNEQQLIGFKTNDAADALRSRNANKQLSNYFSTMVQIKLLTSLPEIIWSHIDQEHFYKATELFIYSRHISTGLQLDASNPLMQQLPIAKKQWDILRPFHATIRQHVINVLERESLSAEVAADCLLSLLLLEKNDLSSVLKILLQLRSTAFRHCLKAKNNESDQQHRRVKERILASLKVLYSTIELISKCVLENGLLFQKLASLADSSSPPTITLIDNNDAEYAYLLPDIIANFRPKLSAQALDRPVLRSLIEQWLTEIDRIALEQLKQLFELVTTLHTIQEIKHEANVEKNHINTMPLAEQLELTHSLDFYTQKYAPLINQRVRDIIKDSWTHAINTTYEAVQQTLQNIDALQPIDIWSEQTTDLPLSLAEALSEDIKIKQLLMKAKGYDQVVIELCTAFDSKLADIIKELHVLLAEESTKMEDKTILIEFLRDIAETQLTHFLTQLKALDLECTQRAELLFVLHACAALIELCPHLKICFCQQTSWSLWISNVARKTSIEHWVRFCGLVEEEIIQFWQKIVDGLLKEQHCAKYLPQNMTHDVALGDFVHWESVTLEQKDDQDNAFSSTFHIPNQPRISLQLYLFSLIRTLNTAIPQTLPVTALKYLNNQLLMQLLEHYQQYAIHQTNDDETISSAAIVSSSVSQVTTTQNVALQFYFDLKFLQSIYNVTREDRTLATEFQKLQNLFKNMIDPFDFELFAEHIGTNVKRAVLRLNCGLGVLTPATATTPTATTATSLAQEKEPNVLSLSSSGSTSLWFPLLPIITTTTTMPAAASAEVKRNVALQETTEKTTPTRSKASGAASTTIRKSDATTKSKSFFGAMSQEWFR